MIEILMVCFLFRIAEINDDAGMVQYTIHHSTVESSYTTTKIEMSRVHTTTYDKSDKDATNLMTSLVRLIGATNRTDASSCC